MQLASLHCNVTLDVTESDDRFSSKENYLGVDRILLISRNTYYDFFNVIDLIVRHGGIVNNVRDTSEMCRSHELGTAAREGADRGAGRNIKSHDGQVAAAPLLHCSHDITYARAVGRLHTSAGSRLPSRQIPKYTIPIPPSNCL